MNNITNEKINLYKILEFNDNNIFSGKIPKDAAHKVFQYLLKFIDNLNENLLVFTIINIKTNKEYTYIGTRIKLKNPIYEIKNKQEIKYIYKDVINKYYKQLE
jgi:hypothetical protein